MPHPTCSDEFGLDWLFVDDNIWEKDDDDDDDCDNADNNAKRMNAAHTLCHLDSLCAVNERLDLRRTSYHTFQSQI